MKKSEVYGAVGTIVISALLLLLLFLLGLSVNPPPKPEQGIEIAFGDGLDGAPAPEVSSTPQEATSAVEPTPSVPTPSQAPNVVTQEDPSVAIEAAKKKEQEKQRQDELHQEQERVRQQQAKDAAEKAATAERAAKSAKATALAAGAFGGGGNSATGKGPGGGGQGNTPGNPLGKGTSGTSSWSLANRNMTGTFYKPSYVGDQEGKIIVAITVDKTGTVIAASIKQGTTISDEGLREECKNAARKLKFSSDLKANGNAIGEIIYRFSQQ